LAVQRQETMTMTVLGGFPWHCYDNACETPAECLMYGCKVLLANGRATQGGTPTRPPVHDSSISLWEEECLLEDDDGEKIDEL
jgi:hypothetical protein